MEFSLKPNFKVAGSILGSKIKEFSGYLAKVDSKEFLSDLDEKGSLEVTLQGESTEIIKDYVLVNIKAKEGFDVSMDNNLFVILDTHLNEELIEEGYVREVISKIQQLRKQEDLDVLDNIDIYIDSVSEIKNALEKNLEHLKSEVLATNVEFKEFEGEKYDINGLETGIKIERIKGE